MILPLICLLVFFYLQQVGFDKKATEQVNSCYAVSSVVVVVNVVRGQLEQMLQSASATGDIWRLTRHIWKTLVDTRWCFFIISSYSNNAPSFLD